MSRTKLLQLPLTLSLALIWALVANAQQPLNYEPPPGGDAPPPETATGSTRPGCPAVTKRMRALVPKYYAGFTVASHPTFWVYVPYATSTARPLVATLRLWDGQQTRFYTIDFAVSNTPGIVKVSFPNNAPSLVIDKIYQWDFLFYCGREGDIDSVQGWVKRVPLSDSLKTKLETASPRERIRLYSVNGLWHEALTDLAELRRKVPQDEALKTDWRELLSDRDVRLDELISESLVECCSEVSAENLPQEKAYQLRLQGVQQVRLGEFKEALESLEQALAIYRELDVPKEEARILNDLAAIRMSMGEPEQAIALMQQSLTISESLRDFPNVAAIMGNLGQAHFVQGRYREAIGFYEKVLSIVQSLSYDQVSDWQTQANALDDIATAYRALGEYQKALEFYEKSLEISQSVNAGQREAVTLGNLGNIHYILGQYEVAIEFQRKYLTLSRNLGDKLGEANALANLGLAYSALGEYRESIQFYQQALEKFRTIGYPRGEAFVLSVLGETYFALKEYPNAIESYQQSLNIAKRLDDRLREVVVLGDLALISDARGQQQQAVDLYQQALEIAQAIGARAEEGQILSNLGLTLFKQSQLAEAEKALFAAIKVRESLRQGLDDQKKISLFDTQVSPYRALQQVLIARNNPTAALEVAERGRARAFVELLATRLSSQSDIPELITSPSSEQIRQTARLQQATLVEYSIIDEPDKPSQLFIWVVKPNGEIAFRNRNFDKTVSPKNLVKEMLLYMRVRSDSNFDDRALKKGVFVRLKGDPLAWWREVIEVNRQNSTVTLRLSNHPDAPQVERSFDDIEEISSSPRTIIRQLAQLHEVLIEPIADLLPTNPSDRVIFIPQRELFLVPFPALQDTTGKSLIEKHTILTAPAIQILDLTRQQKAKVQRANLQDAVVVGNPTMPSQQLAALPQAEEEAKAIAPLLNTQAIIGEEATKRAIVQRLPKARWIHLATHGILDETSGLESAIALAPSGNDSGFLTAEEILSLNLNAELVILSACNTGKGRITGDGIIGLSRSLISAGVPSVIVSLWQVPDAPTAFLMKEFYQNLQRNPDKAQALRNAMLATMKQHSDPRNWAAFTLIGEI